MASIEKAINLFIARERKRRSIPGVSVAVIHRGELIYTGGYGHANLEVGAKAKADTVYQLASVTKQFVATGVIMLCQEGYLGLDDSVSDYLEYVPKAWKPIKIRHLLTMTSGIIDVENDLPSQQDTIRMLALEYSDQELLRLAAIRPCKFKPGERYAYSNTGYHMLGMILKEETGLGWGEFLKERIFDPLRMNNTRANNLTDIVANRAAGYWLSADRLVNGPRVSQAMSAYAAGGLRSTVLDLAKWDAALDEGQILDEEALSQMWAPVTLNDGSTYGYGFGWAVGTRCGHRYVRHGGSRESGFETHLCRYVDLRLTVAVLTNRFNCNPSAIADGIAAIVEPSLAEG